MLAADFATYVLAIHIAAVVVAFGVTFAYPIVFTVGERLDKRHLAWFHEVQGMIGRRLIMPGLGVVLVAGIYLASKWHQWSEFYVGWGMAVALFLGALGGLFFTPTEARASELARRDIEAAGDGPVTMSAEYMAVRGKLEKVGALGSALVMITVVIMTVRP